MKGGWIAGRVAVDSVRRNNFSIEFLENYSNKMWNDFGKNYDRFYKIKQAVENLTDDDLNDIANKVLLISEDKRNLRSVFKAAVFKKPSLIIDVLKVFAGV